MNNYEYIIASLPVLTKDAGSLTGLDSEELIEEIRGQLDRQDRCCLDFLMESYDGAKLTKEFYTKALSHRSPFIRDYFSYDLGLRNTKVLYLDKKLGREPMQDCISLSEEGDAPEAVPEVDAVLQGTDILARERGLDDLVWNRIEELNQMKVFDLDVILGFVVKLKIVDRWLKLDPESGKALFKKLVEEIRTTK